MADTVLIGGPTTDSLLFLELEDGAALEWAVLVSCDQTELLIGVAMTCIDCCYSAVAL